MDITVKAMNMIVKRLGAALALAVPALALAHTGAGDAHTHANFASGLLHPLGGADHLAAMVTSASSTATGSPISLASALSSEASFNESSSSEPAFVTVVISAISPIAERACLST